MLLKSPYGNDLYGTDSYPGIVPQNLLSECPAPVHKSVCVRAGVTIRPVVKAGEVQFLCLGSPTIGADGGKLSRTGNCAFTVRQNICLQIPLTCSAAAAAEPNGIICGLPASGPCPPRAACTHTIGYYQSHPMVTNALITSAGGFIVLGIGEEGASFTVTSSNANEVLFFHTPSPPAPASQPFSQPYQSLYAQLLAGDLNVLAGAACHFAVQAIAAANSFLAASPPGIGRKGAEAAEEALTQFNQEKMPG